MTVAAVELYGSALGNPSAAWNLRDRHGVVRALSVARWVDDACDVDAALLDRVDGPVLDVGCGPGRLVVALAERGVAALGVDISPAAVALARQRGAMVLRRSIFDPVPGQGRWASALLVDGNLGIGGDPVGLLRRLGAVLRPGGHVLAEVEAPGLPSRSTHLRIEGAGTHSAWFPWAEVGADSAADLAAAAAMTLVETWQGGERWFVRLRNG